MLVGMWRWPRGSLTTPDLLIHGAGIFAQVVRLSVPTFQNNQKSLPAGTVSCWLKGSLMTLDSSIVFSGRCGDALWGFQCHGVVPDIITIGKSLGNGYPIAAVITSREIAKKFTSYVSYNKYLGDPTSCNVALAVLDQLEHGGQLENVKTLGKYMLKKLQSYLSNYDFVGNVRGIGFSLAIDLVKPEKEANSLLAQCIRQKLFERRVVVEICGEKR